MSDRITRVFNEPPYDPDRDQEAKAETGKLPLAGANKIKEKWITIISISILFVIAAIIISIFVRLSAPYSPPFIKVPELIGTWEADWGSTRAYEKNPSFSCPLSQKDKTSKALMESWHHDNKRIIFKTDGRVIQKPVSKGKTEYTLHSRSNGHIVLTINHYIHPIFSSKKRTMKGGMEIQVINPDRFALRITEDCWMIYNKIESARDEEEPE